MRNLICLSVSSVAIGLILLSCGSYHFPTAKGYSQLCQSFVGQNHEKLIRAWGQPGRTYDGPGPNETMVYVYTIDEYSINPMAHAALLEFPPRVDMNDVKPEDTTSNVIGEYVPSTDYCVTYFEVKPDGTVNEVIWKGNCTALEHTEGEETF